MRTKVETMNPAQHRVLAAMALNLLDTLTFRHHGLGMFQAYIQEGETEEVRLHVWHPSLVVNGAEWSGSYHDHRFDMTSYVLVGSVPHKEVVLLPGKALTAWSVKNARNVVEESLEPNFTKLDEYDAEVNVMQINEGQQYTFGKKEFHQSFPITELAVTLVVKQNQEKTQARILSPTGIVPEHMTRGRKITDQVAMDVLNEARAALIRVLK